MITDGQNYKVLFSVKVRIAPPKWPSGPHALLYSMYMSVDTDIQWMSSRKNGGELWNFCADDPYLRGWQIYRSINSRGIALSRRMISFKYISSFFYKKEIINQLQKKIESQKSGSTMSCAISQLVYMPNFRAIGQSVWEKNADTQTDRQTWIL